jgi:hypothetical protein
MPTLEIRRARLRPEYAAMTFNYLLGIMLWPVECDARRDFMRTCAAGWKIDLNTAVPGLQSDIELLLNEAIDVSPRESLSQQMRPRLARGERVGLELAKAIAEATWGNPARAGVNQELAGRNDHARTAKAPSRNGCERKDPAKRLARIQVRRPSMGRGLHQPHRGM